VPLDNETSQKLSPWSGNLKRITITVHRMRGSRFLAALAVGSLLIAACSGGSSNDGTAAKAEPATDVPVTEIPPTEPAAGDVVTAPASLQFTAPLVGGGEIDAATLAGKPTLFWFWAPT
jgi:ABC-type glycerol-3-phosphate transport system substrate-binding protein